MDAMITDPPGGIGFCGEEWDSDRGGASGFVAWLTLVMQSSRRLMKPGAFGMVWAYPRTSHWTGTALENAGWEIEDKVFHLYCSGMGRGAKLKPAIEEWWVVRNPFKGSARANVAKHGVGVLNIDAGRVPRDKQEDVPGWHKTGAMGSNGFAGTDTFKIRDMSAEEIQERCGDKDRWPPNLTLGEGGFVYLESLKNGLGRYFPLVQDSLVCYAPKPSRAEKEAGCQDLPLKTLRRVNPGGLEREPRFAPIQVRNNHKTVKPVKLMQWLLGLALPTMGWNRWVLDPFAGSGTTGVACARSGVSFFGMEKDPDSFAIANARINHAFAERMGQQRLFEEEEWE